MKRILVVDDDKDISEMVQVILADDYEVECRSEYAGLVDKLKSFDPHLVLLDNSLGQRSSGDFILELKNITELKGIPIVLFSAHHDIEKIASQVKADDHLAKPFSLTELHNVLEKHIGDRSSTS